MCHGSDVLPGQSAISDSDLLLDSTFCEKEETGFPVFWYHVPTVQWHGSYVSLCRSAISDSDLLLDGTFCEKKDFPVFFVPWTYCSVQEPWIRMSHPAASWVTSVKKKQTKRNGACMCSAKYFFKLYVYIFFWCFVCRSKPLTPTGKTNNTHMLNFFPIW